MTPTAAADTGLREVVGESLVLFSEWFDSQTDT